MRVGTASLYAGIQQRLQRLTADLDSLNEKIASGKKVNRPSDDPIATVEAMQFKTATRQMDQYGRNLKTAGSWFTASESALSQTLDLVARVHEIAVTMNSDNQNAQTRDSAAVEVGELLDQAISLGNTELSGRYIFSGFETATAPFTKVMVGGVETAQYNGDTNDFQVQIGKDENLTAGKNGQTVLMDSTLFSTLGSLKKALEDNDLDGVNTQLGNLTSVEDYLNNQIADIGGRQNRAEVKANILGQLQLDLQDRLSQAEDADIAEVMIQLNSKQVIYQAALAAAARVSQMSLLDYLN
ncbi:MAG: flagellar hook-associated protein FlgL [Deltaproteobacteria bacterium]|nr:flagellar hook-associated protein FlgL [Deltaproteobacteria bacterium]